MLTKSDFLKYTQCIKYLWLHKYRKDLIPKDISVTLQRTFDEGYNVEAFAYELFPGGASAEAADISDAIIKTKKLFKDGQKIIFQPTISIGKLFCRADIIKYNAWTKCWDIYEVKSSTQVKDIHLIDLAFQKITFEEAKIKIGKLFLVHVNNQYVRKGKIEPKKLLTVEEVSGDVLGLIKGMKMDIRSAHKILDLKKEPEIKILGQCENPYTCNFIDYCWQHVPEDSVYDIAGGLSLEKLEALLDQGILSIKDIPEGVITSKRGLRHYRAVKLKKVFIDQAAIKKELAGLKYPLYFLDYETNSPAVPLFDGFHPYQRIVFQYSLHVKKSPNSKVEHFEFLETDLVEPTLALVKTLTRTIGSKGTVIAWNKGFEMGCNKEMAERCPAFAEKLLSINERMYDLMDTFKKGYYVHKNFHGSASLKKVLPVLVPKLSYKALNIQEGGTASESWMRVTDEKVGEKERKALAKDMLDYCRLDTLAMVEILRVLNNL